MDRGALEFFDGWAEQEITQRSILWLQILSDAGEYNN